MFEANDLSMIFFQKLDSQIDLDVISFVNKYIIGFSCPVYDLPICNRYQNYECNNCYVNIKSKNCPNQHKVMYHLLLFLRNNIHFIFSLQVVDVQEATVFARKMFQHLIELLRIIKIIKKV
jgi:hypothetical protein